MPRTVREEIAIEQRGVRGSADKRGSDDPHGIEHESFEAQAVMFKMFPYLRAKHPALAAKHGYRAA